MAAHDETIPPVAIFARAGHVPAFPGHVRRVRFPTEHGEVLLLLHSLNLDAVVREFGGLDGELALSPIGELRNRRSQPQLSQAAEELLELFGDDLAPPDRGKTRELCERLYPELLAA